MSSALSLLVLGQAYLLHPLNGVSLILPTAMPVLNTRQIRRDYYNYTYDIGAHKIYDELKNWNKARRACQEDGGYLSIVNSEAESEVIAELLGQAEMSNAWAGIQDYFDESEYITMHGESLVEAGFDEWLYGEPDNAGNGEHCGKVERVNTSVKYGDAPCERRKGYICELPIIQPALVSQRLATAGAQPPSDLENPRNV